MKIKVLSIVLSGLFAIGHQYNFTGNPQCSPILQTAKQLDTTFVFVLDLSIPWRYLERLHYLYKHISCGIPSASNFSLVASQVFNNGGQVIGPLASVDFPDVLFLNIGADERDTRYCNRARRALRQLGEWDKPYLLKNVQFIVPIIDPSCSMVDVFNEEFEYDKRRSEFHFNGILINNGNWSEEKRRKQNIIVDIPNITILDPQMKSMTSGEDVNYVIETADIVQQINNFLHTVMGTSIEPVTSTTEPTTEIVETFPLSTSQEILSSTTSSINHTITKRHENDTESMPSISESEDEPVEHYNGDQVITKTDEEYKPNHRDNDTYSAFQHNEDQDDVFRDNFWWFLALIILLTCIIFFLMFAFCICCFRKKKARRTKSPMTGTKSSESRSREKTHSKEPMLIPKKTKPVIIRPKKVLLVHDEVDEWNQIKPLARENEGVSPCPSVSAVPPPVLNEIRITERQVGEVNQEQVLYQRTHNQNKPPTSFVLE